MKKKTMGKFSSSSFRRLQKPSSRAPLSESKTLAPPPPNNPPEKTETLFKSPNLSEAKKLFDSIVTRNNGPPSSTRFHNSVLSSYASIATVDDSVSLLRHMASSDRSFSPDRATFQLLLSHSCKSPYSSLEPVHYALSLMASNGFRPDKSTADVVVRSLCSADRVFDAVEMAKELSRNGCPMDIRTFNFLVKQLCKAEALGSAYQFIDEMKKSFGVEGDNGTYGILIDHVCRSKNLREAARLTGVLSKAGVKPDCYVYNTIMKGCCILNRGNEAVEVYNKMREEGVEPDLVTYNTLIFGLSKVGRMMEAKKFLGVMEEMGHFPDAVTYTTLMDGMCREGDALGGLELLGKMEANGCTPNDCTYNTLLRGLCKSRLLDKGLELLGMMKAGGMKLDSASYGALLKILCGNGRIAEAYGVFDYAVESKSLSDVIAYSLLETILKSVKKANNAGYTF